MQDRTGLGCHRHPRTNGKAGKGAKPRPNKKEAEGQKGKIEKESGKFFSLISFSPRLFSLLVGIKNERFSLSTYPKRWVFGPAPSGS